MPIASIPLDENNGQGSEAKDKSEVIIPAVVASIILIIIRDVVKINFSTG